VLTLEYDGTDYAGSQFQGDTRTIQGALEAAWTKLTGEQVRWNFAGRTDAGVHARGQVANTRTATRHALATIQRALNALLPRDVAVLAAQDVPWDFHARYSAWRRDYRYLILNEAWPSPLERERMLHVPEALDVDGMAHAVEALVGEHDFATFGVVDRGTTVRHCYHAACNAVWKDGRQTIEIELSANGFLRHMVRSVVGTLLQVGRGRLGASDMATILASHDRSSAGPTAPPHGLYLERVWYEGQPAAGSR
jgi:tRNA pseudouridine38-40 synthase